MKLASVMSKGHFLSASNIMLSLLSCFSLKHPKLKEIFFSLRVCGAFVCSTCKYDISDMTSMHRSKHTGLVLVLDFANAADFDFTAHMWKSTYHSILSVNIGLSSSLLFCQMDAHTSAFGCFGIKCCYLQTCRIRDSNNCYEIVSNRAVWLNKSILHKT